MSDAGLPRRAPAALVLIDVIQPFDFDGAAELLEHARPASERIAGLKARAKAAGLPVIYANDHFGGWNEDFSTLVEQCLAAGCPGRDIVARLAPDDDDFYVLKPMLSAFFAAPLEALLRDVGAETVILAGFAGDICVHATALDGHMRGFGLVIPSDCTASQSQDENERVLAYAHRVFGADVRPSEALDLDALAGAPEAD